MRIDISKFRGVVKKLAPEFQKRIEAVIRDLNSETWQRAYKVILDGSSNLWQYVRYVNPDYPDVVSLDPNTGKEYFKKIPSRFVLETALEKAYFNVIERKQLINGTLKKAVYFKEDQE